MNTETTTVTASRAFPASSFAQQWGAKSGLFTVTATTDRGHFSVTAELRTTDRRFRDPTLCCGCMHEDAVRFWPAVAPIIALHLSDSETGEPMHAEANGLYWLAGAVPGNLGQQYHGGSGSDERTPAQCLDVLARHLRITGEEAQRLAVEVGPVHDVQAWFAAYVETLRPRWKREAEEGVALIRRLANVPAV